VLRFREAIATAILSLYTSPNTPTTPHCSCFCCTQYTLTNVTHVRVGPVTSRVRLLVLVLELELVLVLVLVLVRVARVHGPKRARACAAPHTRSGRSFHHKRITGNLRSDRNECLRVRVVVFGFAC
jgi:hypothetical protein